MGADGEFTGPGMAPALACIAVIDTARTVRVTARQPTRIGDISPMSLTARLEALKERHASLEARIFEEDNRPLPDSETLARLKIEKLQIKDEMERLRGQVH